MAIYANFEQKLPVSRLVIHFAPTAVLRFNDGDHNRTVQSLLSRKFGTTYF